MENVDVDGSVIQTVHKTRTPGVSTCYKRQGKSHVNFNNKSAVSSDICASLHFRKNAASLNE
jgi:hypothetical protein